MIPDSSIALMGSAQAPTAYSASDAVVYDEERFTRPCGKRIHQFELDRLLWAISRVPASARVCELGCGTGRFLMELSRRDIGITGVDASPYMLEQLAKKTSHGQGRITTKVAEAAKTGLQANEFALTYAIRLLNQTESPAYALEVVREMMRITRPGGFVLAEFVNDYRPRWGKAARPHRANPTRLKPQEVARAGRDCGGEVVAYRGCFFLGMQAYHAAPVVLLPLVSLADRLLSTLFPRVCARTYILFRKQEG